MTDRLVHTAITTGENSIADCIYKSDFYEIKNWAVDYSENKKVVNEYNDCFCFVFVKKGNFLFDLSTKSYDMHTGHIIIDKPHYEYSLRPSTGECSIFNFTDDFFGQLINDLNLKYSFFFSNSNMLSVLLKSTPEAEYLHYKVIKKRNKAGKMEIDNLVLELLKHLVTSITNSSHGEEVNTYLKAHQLEMVEKAKEYMHDKFATDISLYEISSYSHVSPFHFSRIFKKLTTWSPCQYLLNIRLKHGEMLLKNSTIPVTDVAFSSGFNSVEYFATAFKQKFKMNPTMYRNGI